MQSIDKHTMVSALQMLKFVRCIGFATVDLSELDSCLVQPKSRTEVRAVKRLLETVHKSGVLVPILVCRKKTRYEILDGHRRVIVARLLGLTEIGIVILEPLTRAVRYQLFAQLQETKRMSAKNRWASWAKVEEECPGSGDAFLDGLAPAFAAQIRRSQEIFGTSVAIRMALSEQYTPRVSVAVDTLISLFDECKLDRISEKKIGNWLLDHQTLRAVDSINRSKEPSAIREMHAAIVADESYEVRYTGKLQ